MAYQGRGAERLVAAINEVFDSLNVLGGRSDEAVKDAFRRQHRTLQQQLVGRVILPVLEQLAEMDKAGAYDLRNEASAKLATKLLSGVKEEDRYLPLV